jgi:hypothetical protein
MTTEQVEILAKEPAKLKQALRKKKLTNAHSNQVGAGGVENDANAATTAQNTLFR